MYPKNDSQFEEVTIAEVKETSGGWLVKRSDGWSLFIPELENSSVVPQVGMTLRCYGKGIGYSVRGIFLDGEEIRYQTQKEFERQTKINTYGEDAAEWLRRWDAGKIVWSIEMGGFGPGYEQCIQIMVAEVIRHLVAQNCAAEKWVEANNWKQAADDLYQMSLVNPVITKLGGVSGAQWGAAVSLGTHLYKKGPVAVMTEPEMKSRHIQVSKNFPQG